MAAVERRQVGAILLGHQRVVASFRLVGLQRAQTDDLCAHALQFRDVVLERLVRPRGATFPQWRMHTPVFTASEEGQLDPDGAKLVACVAVLVYLRGVFPSVRRE